jgi:hypothetical protein
VSGVQASPLETESKLMELFATGAVTFGLNTQRLMEFTSAKSVGAVNQNYETQFGRARKGRTS